MSIHTTIKNNTSNAIVLSCPKKITVSSSVPRTGWNQTIIKQRIKCEYEKLNEYYRDERLVFDITQEPTIQDFSMHIGEIMYPVARCVLNTPDNFPKKTRKNGTICTKQREYFEDNPTYMGKKVDYVPIDDTKWDDNANEWLYFLTYNQRIVKIGMTIGSIKERCGSYSCGTRRAMNKGSCSTTNFIISECNFGAIQSGMDVEIYTICCPKQAMTESRFGVTTTIYLSKVRSYETMLISRFRSIYHHRPVLCVQEGK